MCFNGSVQKTATRQVSLTTTAQAQIQRTATRQAQLTSTAQAREAESSLTFDPEDGALAHTDDEYIEADSAGVDLKTFIC